MLAFVLTTLGSCTTDRGGVPEAQSFSARLKHADACEARGDYRQAIAAYDSCFASISSCHVAPDSLAVPVSDMLIDLCNSYQYLGEADSCVSHLKRLERQCPLLRNTLRRDYLSTLAYALSRTEAMDEAEQTMKRALTIPLRRSTPDRLFRDYAYAAAVFYPNLEKNEEVIIWGKKALEEARKANNISGAQYVRTLLGMVYQRCGRLKEAVEMYDKGYDEAEERHDTIGQINTLCQQAELFHYFHIGNYADKYATQAASWPAASTSTSTRPSWRRSTC